MAMEAPSDNLFMTNLPQDVSEEQIKEVFSLYGTVLSVQVVSGGAALVRFESVEEAQSIVTQMSGAVPLGFQEPVTIDFAHPDIGTCGKGGQPQPAQTQSYGKWKMADKKLTTPWSIPNAPAGSPLAPAVLSKLGATSTAGKGKGKGGLPMPAPVDVDEFDALAAQYENEAGVGEAGASTTWNAASALAGAQPAAGWPPVAAAATGPADPDDFDSIFAAYAGGNGNEASSAGSAHAAQAANGWSAARADASAAGAAAAPSADPWDQEEAAWLAGGLGAAAAAAAGGQAAAWGSEGSPWNPSPVPIGGGDWGVDPPPCDNLYIKGLPVGIDEAWLTEALSGIGTVVSVKVLKGSGPESQTTCAAMARFDTVETAASVRDILHGQSPDWCPGQIVARFANNNKGEKGGGKQQLCDYTVADAWPPVMDKGYGKGGKGYGKGKGGKGENPKADLLCSMVDESQVLPGDQHRSPEGSVYIAGLPGDTLGKHVYQLFAPFGAIISVFTKAGVGGRQGGWAIAFVNYVEPLSAQAAIAVYNGFQLPDGSVMKVQLKQARGVPSAPARNGAPPLSFASPAAAPQAAASEAVADADEAMAQVRALLEATMA